MLLFWILSHPPTPEQRESAATDLGASRLLRLPDDLQQAWSNIPPDASLDEVLITCQHVLDWMLGACDGSATGHSACIMGDFTATVRLTLLARDAGFRCVHSATRREAVETTQDDGSVRKTSVFRHVRWRDVF